MSQRCNWCGKMGANPSELPFVHLEIGDLNGRHVECADEMMSVHKALERDAINRIAPKLLEWGVASYISAQYKRKRGGQ